MKPRIAVAGFQHESNSFSPIPTEFADFEMADGWPALTRGADILDIFPPLNIPIGGFLRTGLFDPVPIAWASAEPSGPVADEAFEKMAAILCDGIRAAGPLEGIYLDLHGAMVTASEEDGEGALLRILRRVVGPTLPIAVSLDMHANITREMVDLADVMTVYRTYPHVDMADTGARCAALLAARLEHGPLVKAFRKLPFLIPLTSQCTEDEPVRSIFAELPGRRSRAVLSADIASGFPVADIHECGPAVIAYGSEAAEVAAQADALFDRLLAAEPMFVDRLWDPASAAEYAVANGRRGKPIILADVQDNPGCGGTSDTTTLLSALVKAGARDAAISALWDPESAALAHAAGEGAIVERQVGGRFGYDASPFVGRFRVERLHDGRICGTGAIMAGVTMSLGPVAVLRLLDRDSDLRIVVSSVRFQCLDRAMFAALGIDPEDQAILIVKSSIHFRADFDPIASETILVAAPGAHSCRLTRGMYRQLREDARLPEWRCLNDVRPQHF